MSELRQIPCTGDADPILDVVFVHGLDDDPIVCWTHKKTGNFWPEKLAEDIQEAGIWSLGYDARKIDPLGHVMPILDRARETLETLRVRGIGDRPIVFITHSLGGILVKQMLRHARDYEGTDWLPILNNTNAVVYFSTPHLGAQVASIVRKIPTTSILLEKLKHEDDQLRDLNFAYRKLATDYHLEHKVYVEKHPTFGTVIVGEASADPGLPGVIPIPVDADHLDVCKIGDYGSTVYLGVRAFLNVILDNINGPGVKPDP